LNSSSRFATSIDQRNLARWTVSDKVELMTFNAHIAVFDQTGHICDRQTSLFPMASASIVKDGINYLLQSP
jgi:hypothetical protein